MNDMIKSIAEVSLTGDICAAAAKVDIMDCGDVAIYRHPISECEIHDRLEARLLLLSDGQDEVLWISSEECTCRRHHSGRVKEIIESRAGLSPDRVMLTAIHNHSAHSYPSFKAERFADLICDEVGSLRKQLRPLRRVSVRRATAPSGTMVNRRLKVNSEWGDVTVTNNDDCIVDLDRDALDATGWLVKVLEEFGTSLEREELAENGHMLDGPLDRRLFLWTLLDDTDKPIAAIARVNVHPVSVSIARVGPIVSADYVRPLADRIEAELSCVPLVFNGAFGNARPLQEEYSFKECDRIGLQLAEAMLSAKQETHPVSGLSGAGAVLELRLREDIPRCKKACKRQRDEIMGAAPASTPARAKRRSEAVKRLERALVAGPPEGKGFLLDHEVEAGIMQCEAQAFRLGPIHIIGLPGEPFVELAGAIEGACGHVVVGLANGYVSYLPDPDSLDAGGYESSMCMLDRRTLESLPEIAGDICDRAPGSIPPAT